MSAVKGRALGMVAATAAAQQVIEATAGAMVRAMPARNGWASGVVAVAAAAQLENKLIAKASVADALVRPVAETVQSLLTTSTNTAKQADRAR